MLRPSSGAVIEMAKNIKQGIVAEDVESHEQLANEAIGACPPLGSAAWNGRAVEHSHRTEVR